jgi:hypothetical protein
MVHCGCGSVVVFCGIQKLAETDRLNNKITKVTKIGFRCLTCSESIKIEVNHQLRWLIVVAAMPRCGLLFKTSLRPSVSPGPKIQRERIQPPPLPHETARRQISLPTDHRCPQPLCHGDAPGVSSRLKRECSKTRLLSVCHRSARIGRHRAVARRSHNRAAWVAIV